MTSLPRRLGVAAVVVVLVAVVLAVAYVQWRQYRLLDSAALASPAIEKRRHAYLMQAPSFYPPVIPGRQAIYFRARRIPMFIRRPKIRHRLFLGVH